MRALHEQIKSMRPSSSRARALLETPKAVAQASAAASAKGAAAAARRRTAMAHRPTHALVISREGLREHTAALYREVLPPISGGMSSLDSSSYGAGSRRSGAPGGSGEPSALTSGGPSQLSAAGGFGGSEFLDGDDYELSPEPSRLGGGLEEPSILSTGGWSSGGQSSHHSVGTASRHNQSFSLSHMWSPAKSQSTFAHGMKR